MAIIFLGDITYPFRNSIRFEECEFIFKDKCSIGNLEGVIEPAGLKVRDKYSFNLYSSLSLLSMAQHMNLVAVSLANNHSSDFIGGLDQTLDILQKKKNIDWFGLTKKPTSEIELSGAQYVVMGLCSMLTGSKNQDEAPLEMLEGNVTLAKIKGLRKQYPRAIIVLYVHWGYELACMPQPADREWARGAIQAGANAVIGHHPHVVQGAEYYRNGVIAYSLGNWLLFQGQYYDKRLRYHGPDSEIQMGLELEQKLGELRCIVHLFRYNKEQNKITHLSSEDLGLSQTIKTLTPYAGTNDDEYRRYFKTLNSGKGTPRGYPTFWSYKNFGDLSTNIKYQYIKLKKIVRKWAIIFRLHRPYNWD